jgi:hypothetical protein
MNISQEEKEQFAHNLKITGEQYLKRAEEMLEEVSNDEKLES